MRFEWIELNGCLLYGIVINYVDVNWHFLKYSYDVDCRMIVLGRSIFQWALSRKGRVLFSKKNREAVVSKKSWSCRRSTKSREVRGAKVLIIVSTYTTIVNIYHLRRTEQNEFQTSRAVLRAIIDLTIF